MKKVLINGNKRKNQQICTRCVMDMSDPGIKFNQQGICNYCREFDYKAKSLSLSDEEVKKRLEQKISGIRKAGKGHEYDCLIGLSGGVDSSYLAYLVKKEFNLKPLAVHLDNGWDSKVAVKNIENIVRKLDIDLYTHVVNWEEFKDIQIAYLKASVIDIEAITDHAITAILFQAADEHNIKYILLGTNQATEQILPLSWRFNKNDLINLKSIHKTYGNMELSTFPQMGMKKYRDYLKESNIQFFSPLDYVNYVKEEAKIILTQQLGWKDYGGKHYESIFTRFYQGYILPTKFGVDKRKAHFSTLINSKQMTRDEALDELKKPPYPEDVLREDYEYVIKKLGFTREEFEGLLSLPTKSHFDYPTDLWSKLNYKIYPAIYPLYKKIKQIFPFIEKFSDFIKGSSSL